MIFILVSCEKKSQQVRKFEYCTKEQQFCVSTILDTTALYRNYFSHFPSYTSIREYDTISQIGYHIAWGNSLPDIDWGPFTYYSYDTIYARNKLQLGLQEKPIYFIKLQNVNKKKFITLCNELNGMGIIIHSNYYSDTLNILIETTFIGQYDYSKIDVNKHFDILENTEIFEKK